MKLCILIPFYNHEAAIPAVIASLKPLGLPCLVIDDGSDERCQPALTQIAAREGDWVEVIGYRPNRGKGGAVMRGFEEAHARGYTHVLQIDADGQHDSATVPRLLQLAQQHPNAVITGYGVYDASVPKSRLYGRLITHVWVWINTLSLQIRDSMCGLRVYPLAPCVEICRQARLGERMSFDIEIMVRLVWRGVRVINVPVPVSYPVDGISHFKLWLDNWQISGAHARMFAGMLWRAPLLLSRKLRRAS